MLVLDEQGQQFHAEMAALENQREKYLLSCEREVKDRIHTPRISNAEERLGKPLMPAEFERRLSKLNSNLFFEVIPENTTHKRLSVLDQRGKHFVCVYPNSLIPERSIAKLREMEVPDPTFTHLDRKDMPSDPTAMKPGWRKVVIPWGEAKRGWRTVLVRLIQTGLITPLQAEEEFGADQTPEWAQYTGRTGFTTPF